jgi:hypothetical protein
MGYVFENFSLGWQNRAGHDLMKDEALYRCVDLDMLELGVLRCVKGSSELGYFAAQGYGSEVKNVYQLDVEGNGVLLVYYTTGGSLYRYNSFTGVSTELSDSINETNVSYAPFKPTLSNITYIYITDGTTMLCDNGSSSYTWGIDPPENALSASMYGSGGLLQAGDYTWQYTFYNSNTGTESNPCLLMGAETAGALDSADVKGIETSSNSQVTSRRLYRSLVDGGSHYLVRDIGDNVTTSFIDVEDDDNLTTKMNTDQGVPPTVDTVRNFQNRLFLGGNSDFPNRVWYSRGSRPGNYPTDYYLEVGTVDDRVVDMVEFEGTLFFMQTAGISGLYGTTPDTFAWYKTRSHVGIAGKYSAVSGPDGIYFLGFDGVYRFDGVKSVRVSEQVGRTFGKLTTDWISIVHWDTVDEVCRSCFLNGVLYMLLPVIDKEGSVTNVVLSYDIFQQTWTELSLDCDYIYSDIGRGKVYGSYLVGSRYTVLELLELVSGVLGDNDPTPEFVTKSVEFGRSKDGSRVKWLRRFRVDAEGSWTVYFYVDNVLRYTKALSGIDGSDRYVWYDFDEEIKGFNVYAKVVATGSSDHGNRVFKSLEVD